MGELIFGYMSHHAYWDTAAVIARDMLEGTVQVAPKEVQEVKLRNTIADDVVAGEPHGSCPHCCLVKQHGSVQCSPWGCQAHTRHPVCSSA